MSGFQDKNKFEPDYKLWWNKKDLTKKELATLCFGVNPAAFDHFTEITNRSRTPEEEQYSDKFADFYKSLGEGDIWRISELRAYLLKNASWEGKKPKIGFVKDVYEDGMRYLGSEINQSFVDFLKKQPGCKEIFVHEKYKDHEQYEADLSSIKASQIKSAEEAAAILLGLNLEYLKRASGLRQALSDDEEKGYDKLSGEDKFFLHQYRIFINKYYGHASLSPFYYIAESAFDTLRSIKFGSLSQFANQAYNDYGFLYRDSVMEFLEQNNISLRYEPDSWVVKYYKFFGKEPTWSIEQAFQLFKGQFEFSSSSKNASKSVADLREVNSLFSYFGGDKYAWAWDGDIDEYVNIYERLEKQCDAEEIEYFIGDDNEKRFKPNIIITWLKSNCDYIPCKAIEYALKQAPTYKTTDLSDLPDKEGSTESILIAEAINNLTTQLSTRLDKINDSVLSLKESPQEPEKTEEVKADKKKRPKAEEIRKIQLEALIEIILDIEQSLNKKQLPQTIEEFINVCWLLPSCEGLNDPTEYQRLFKMIGVGIARGRKQQKGFWLGFKEKHQKTIKEKIKQMQV